MAARRKTKEARPQRRSSSTESTTTSCALVPEEPHQVEKQVKRELLAHPEFTFSSLVVRRVLNGVCLEGVVETDTDLSDVARLLQSVVGVNEVLNHLVVRQPPVKG